MKPPKHSKAAIKAHPAPERDNYKDGKEYAEACKVVHEARIEFDKPKPKFNKEAIIDKIAAGLAEGQTLRAMCRENEMPSYHTVYNWINADEGIISRIACAREAGYDCIADQIIEIVDESGCDVVVDKDGNERVNAEVVARSRLRAETRLKLLAKWSPKKYGDKTTIAGDAENPLVIMSATERDARIAELLAKKQS